jgi:hypothetical protein
MMKIETIEKLVLTYPNDSELGEKIREYYFETLNNTDFLRKQTIYNKNEKWIDWLKNKFWKH